MPRDSINRLKQTITFFQALIYGLGLILGAGIYVIIGDVAAIAGNALWISFVIAAVIAMVTGLSYANLASVYPKSAAEYYFIKKIFSNNLIALVIGLLSIYTSIISATTVAVGFSNYFSNIFPLFNPPLISIILIVGLSLINYYGISQSIHLNVAFTFVEISGLIVIIMAGLLYGNFISTDYFELPSIDNNITVSQNNIFGNLPIFIVIQASALVFFAYFGFENVVNISDETINAKVIIPKALILSIVISSIIYIAVALSAVSLLGWEGLSRTDAPLATVAQKVFGTWGFLVMSIIALFATFNTTLMMLISSSRIIYGISEDRSLPYIFSKVHKDRKTPWISILLVMFLSVIIIILFSANLEILASMSVFGIFIVYIMVNFSLIWKYIKGEEFYFNPQEKIKKKKIKYNFNPGLILPSIGIMSIGFILLQLPKEIILWGMILNTLIVFISILVNQKIKSNK